MINNLKHFVLLAHATVHDEEALTSLELAGRTAAKVNECIDEINNQVTLIEEALDEIPQEVKEQIAVLLEDGTLKNMIDDGLYGDMADKIAAIENRLSLIIGSSTATEGNTELIDARISAAGSSYNSTGSHVRAVATGDAFKDAVRPGTVKPFRLSSGMLTGGHARVYTIPEYITTAGKWSGSGYVDPDTLEVVEHTSYSFTDKFPCEYGDIFEVDTAIYGNKIPVAIWYNAAGKIIGTSGGDAGTLTWDIKHHIVTADKANVAYVAFQCGQGIANFYAARISPRHYPDPREAMGGRGYIRCNAFNRTDTITDRAQVKLWFPVSEGDSLKLRIEPLEMLNVAAWTVRLFAATDEQSYSLSLPETDTGRKYSVNGALSTFLTVPAHAEDSAAYTHLAVFVDLIAADPEQRINASFAVPTLQKVYADGVGYDETDYIDYVNVALHGAIDGDCVGVVPAGAIKSPLWRKRIDIVGDSLAKGNTLPKADSWFNIACSRYDMTYNNRAVNGQAVVEMANYTFDYSGLDYFVIQGGANDKRLNYGLEPFKAAIHTIIDQVRAASPQCKILLMTNWHRTTNANSLGLYDYDYVGAMLEVAEERNVPCVNNYVHSLNLLDNSIMTWADEGYVSEGVPNIHFSRAANVWLADKFIHALEGI